MKALWLAAVLAAAVMAGVECPIHGDSGAFFTGKTQSADGVLMREYHCSRGATGNRLGHEFWVRADKS